MSEGNPAEIAVPADVARLRALVQRAQAGDESTLPVLRKMVAADGGVQLFGGDLAAQAELAFVRAIAGQNLPVREALLRKLDLLRAELLGTDPTPLERLLVERVVACWLQVQDADIRYAQAQGTLSPRQGEYHQKRMDAATRRYLAALKTLAQVRRLAVPVLQVNIAKKQVNVAGTGIVTD